MSPKRITQPPYPDVVVISGEEYRAKTKVARRYTAALLCCVVLALGSVAFTQWKIRDAQTTNFPVLAEIQRGNKDAAETLEIIKDATSSGALVRQHKVLEDAFASIDCLTRQSINELVQNLIDAGLLPPDALIECKTVEAPPAAATTTTTPEGN